LNCRTRAIPSLSNLHANTTLTLPPKFPFLHQLQPRAPFRNTPPLILECGGSATAFEDQSHFLDSRFTTHLAPPYRRSSLTSAIILLFHLSTFLIHPIHFSSCGNSFFHLTLYFPSRYLYLVKDVHFQ